VPKAEIAELTGGSTTGYPGTFLSSISPLTHGARLTPKLLAQNLGQDV
jgi:hypothetical protein